MKKFTLFCVISFVVYTLSAQSTRKSVVTPSPFPQQITDIDDISTMLYKIEGIRYSYEFTYDQYGNLSQELYTDLDDANSSFKCTYTYDAQQNMLMRNIYSWLNNEWFYSSYEEFTYNEQNQRITRTNANDVGNGFVTGGVGYYEYNEFGKLASYRQQVNMGNNYENIDSMVYNYDENQNWIGCESYSFENNTWTLYYRSVVEYNANGKLDNVADYYYSGGVWDQNVKYVWTYNNDNNPEERTYHIADGNGGWSTPQDKYVFRYRNDIESQNVLFPHVASIYNEWESWFGASYPLDQEDWWTINLNDNLLTFIETATYYYTPFHAAINELSQSNISVFPNPVQDQLFVEFDDYKNINVMIYDIAGKLIQQETMNHSNAISMSDFSSGIYIVKVFNDNQIIAVQKVVKQ